jgi:Rhs element Vgr protein
MNVQTRTTIQINGETYTELAALEIGQQINNHHSFRVILGSEKIGEASNAFLEKAREYAGSEITIEITNTLEERLEFKGVVLQAHSSGAATSELGHNIILEGYSPTILLDSGAHCNAYVDKTLQNIADEICQKAPQNLINASVNPVLTQAIPYTVQYNESWFAFLNRLACRHGEWFYYDGLSLIFGTKKQEPIDLYYGTDLLSFDLGLSLNALGQSFSARSYRENTQEFDSINAYSTSMSGHAAFAIEKSNETFLNAPAINLNQFDEETGLKSQLNKLSELSFKAEAARRVTFSGRSNNPALKLGSLIKVNYNSRVGVTQHGEYLVTGVQHQWQQGGQYQNSFTAIPSDVEVSPTTNPALVPQCSAQTALVVDNNDPDGLGRIKVKYNWQTQGESPWMRIALPYGGANKGMYFIPEIDEEVMVGFEGDNAEKPFVLGALYHGKAKPEDWATETNDKKCIRTRSGHTIELDDTDGEEKIKIYDNEGSIITFDTAEKSLSIVSAENIDISAKNISISAEENITIGAKGDIDIAAEGNLTPQAKGNVAIQSTGDTTVKSSGAVTLEATTDAMLKGQNVTAEGQMNADVKGGMQTTVAGTMTQVKGAAFMIDVK